MQSAQLRGSILVVVNRAPRQPSSCALLIDIEYLTQYEVRQCKAVCGRDGIFSRALGMVCRDRQPSFAGRFRVRASYPIAKGYPRRPAIVVGQQFLRAFTDKRHDLEVWLTKLSCAISAHQNEKIAGSRLNKLPVDADLHVLKLDDAFSAFVKYETVQPFAMDRVINAPNHSLYTNNEREHRSNLGRDVLEGKAMQRAASRSPKAVGRDTLEPCCRAAC